jgi:hypothetical protein
MEKRLNKMLCDGHAHGLAREMVIALQQHDTKKSVKENGACIVVQRRRNYLFLKDDAWRIMADDVGTVMSDPKQCESTRSFWLPFKKYPTHLIAR